MYNNSPVPVANSFQHLLHLNENGKSTEVVKSAQKTNKSSSKELESNDKEDNLAQNKEGEKHVEACLSPQNTVNDSSKAITTYTEIPQAEKDKTGPLMITEHGESDEDNTSEYASDESDEDIRDEEDKYEECNSTDEEELLNAFAPRTSWKDQSGEIAVEDQTKDLIMKGSLSPRQGEKNKKKEKNATGDLAPLTRAKIKAKQIVPQSHPFND
ncbi:uncharacterized protein [Nicotiana tomentosiformis]|uniref:YTH domain-containing protein 1-like n=1 Tax=Nicotiana tabacum TaxID=4097 RepID=A0A1S3Z267_TOBAC|nr:PREDICTED: YTH domain-containing protein 1-like [Nicotiana tabacum]